MLVVGHLTEDLTPDGPRLGGAAAYAGLLAHRFGAPVTILTAADAAFPWCGPLAGIRLHRLPSPDRTRFENRYRKDGAREQTLLTRAATIPETAIRQAVAGLPPGSLVFYGPVADEFAGNDPLPRPFGQRAFAAVAPQGLLRRRDAAGRVSLHSSPAAAARLRGLDLVALSESELAAAPEIGLLQIPVLAITRGRRGARLRRTAGPDLDIPPVPAIERDPTGAGDVFAAALAIGLWRGVPTTRAARLAAAAAAITVESPGIAGIPTLAEATARLGEPPEPSGG